MNQIIAMAVKDIRLIFRDRMAFFFIAGFPILMGLFFGLVMGQAGSGSGDNKMRVALIDQDQSEVSRRFVESLQQNDNLQLEMTDLESARDSVRKGNRVGMIVLPAGFGESAGMFWGDPPVVQVGLDPSRAAESAMLQGFIMQGIGDLIGQRFQNPQEFLPSLAQSRDQVNSDENMSAAQRLLLNGFFNSVESMINSADLLQDDSETTDAGGEGMQFADIQTLDVTRQIDPDSIRAQVSKINSRWDISFPQGMLWGVLSCAAGFAISIARERSQGTLTRLQVAPIDKSSILAGKALACFVTSIAVMILLTVLGVLLNMQPNSYAKLAVAAICVGVAFTGIMMVISVLGKTEQSVSGAGWAIMMVMAMIGGAMIPTMFLPGFLQSISMISPVKWSIQAIEGAVWRQFTWLEMALPLGILIATGMVCFVVGTQILKRQTA